MSLEAACQSQGAGWHRARTSHPGWGAFLLEPTGLSPGFLPSPREMEHTLFLLVFKDKGGIMACKPAPLGLTSQRGC